jgi:hypothetical protein
VQQAFNWVCAELVGKRWDNQEVNTNPKKDGQGNYFMGENPGQRCATIK